MRRIVVCADDYALSPGVSAGIRELIAAGRINSPWAAAASVGIAMAAMFATRTMHPPAGIDPLIIVSDGMPWTFFFIPVLAGAVLLVCFAFVWHNTPGIGSHRHVWPKHWWN
jgi:CBS-domain-containing membrane protein